jgi:sirohydrochlorin cobaltochelatase
MNKIKFFVLSLVAACVAMSFTACKNGEETITERIVTKTDTITKEVKTVVDNNWSRYQDIVNQDVKKNKQHNKVILLVAFGSTWEQAFNAFDTTVDAYKKAFKDYDVFLSYSSAICINRAAAAENGVKRDYYAPNFWLNAFGADGVEYREIVVQSLQVIPGEEYTRVINYIKDFMNNANGDLNDDYLKKFAFTDEGEPGEYTIRLGVPLLQDAANDVPEVAKQLDLLYHDLAANNLVAFMGHGNPDSYDTYKANVRYTQLEEALQAINNHYFVGTVDMAENFKPHVYDRIYAKGLTSQNMKIYLHPLMSIDGDHGHNDMGGDDMPEGWSEGSNTFDDLQDMKNEEGEVEDCSWKVYFGAKGSGLTCNDETVIAKGLLELESIRQVWMNHTQNAIDGEPLDYYHSKNPE